MEIELINVLRLFSYFFIYSFFGWILESVYKTIYEKKWVNSGFLYGPLCPIYGTGAIIMILFLSSFKNNIFLLFLVAVIVLSIWEYFVGWLLEKLFNTKYWDYSNNRFNIQGRICMFNSIVWGILGVIFIGLVHPTIEGKIFLIKQNVLLYITIVLTIPFLIDTIKSVMKVKAINKAIDKFKIIGDNLKDKLEELKELKDGIGEKFVDVKDGITEKIVLAKEEISEKFGDVKEGIEYKFSDVKDGIGDKIADVKEGIGIKFTDVKEDIGDKISDVKESLEDKIKGIEKVIEELKEKQNIINLDIYSKSRRLKKAFPEMKSNKISIFFNNKNENKNIELKKTQEAKGAEKIEQRNTQKAKESEEIELNKTQKAKKVEKRELKNTQKTKEKNNWRRYIWNKIYILLMKKMI